MRLIYESIGMHHITLRSEEHREVVHAGTGPVLCVRAVLYFFYFFLIKCTQSLNNFVELCVFTCHN